MTLSSRWAMFLFGCILARLAFVYAAKFADPKWLPWMGGIAAIIAASFMYLWVTGSRQTGAEVDGGPIWWTALRPIHALFYGLFAYLAFQQSSDAWKPLAVDVLFGLAAFFYEHSSPY